MTESLPVEQAKRIAELEAENKEYIEREYEQRQRARQAEAQRDICHASAADWHGQALLLQDELAALIEMTDDLRAFLHVGDVVTVHTEGRKGSLTFSMNRFAEKYGQAERGTE